MFNPYSCRPIGSGRFEEHLKDVQTATFYDSEFRTTEESPVGLCERGHLPWNQAGLNEDPYTKLYWAIVTSALIEYLEEYEKKIRMGPDEPAYWVHESRCLMLENDYFRKDPGIEKIFEKMLFDVCWMGEEEIENCRKRLMRAIGWLKRSERSEAT